MIKEANEKKIFEQQFIFYLTYIMHCYTYIILMVRDIEVRCNGCLEK